MIEPPHYGFPLRRTLIAVLALSLGGCAGTDKASYNLRAPAPGSYFTVEVHSGDSLSDLARHYQVKEDDLLAMNDIPHPDRVSAGGRLRVPAYGLPYASREDRLAASPISNHPRIERTALRDLTPAHSDAAVPIPRPRPGPSAREAAQAAPAQQAWWSFDWLSSAGSQTGGVVKFLWPVQGRVISPFGSSSTGERNDGINISTTRGAPVRAAASGTVTYVGNELKGYGNLVLIRHDNGYVTAYAHSDSIKVSRGEHVERGQVIAYAGSTGDVGEPQLHFELRAGTRPVDPKPYLVASN